MIRGAEQSTSDGITFVTLGPSLCEHYLSKMKSPCRHEKGDFWALDLGGTNFRTLYIKLSANHGEVVSNSFKGGVHAQRR